MLLRTLGGLALDGSDLKRPRPLLLLAFVALEGVATRRELSDLFFMHTVDPRDSLSAALGQLRRQLDGEIVLDDNTVTTTVACDAVGLLNDFDDFRFESVIKAYGGPFCAGYDQVLGEELEEWLFSTREKLGARMRSALVYRSRMAAADGRLDDARRAVTDALALTEAPELTQPEMAELLEHMLAIDSPELPSLQELAAELGVADTGAANLREAGVGGPAGVVTTPATARSTTNSPFVGRGRELASLIDLLRSPDERIITITGLGGIGKSRLVDRVAQLAAEDLNETFTDGVHTVHLENVTLAEEVPVLVGARLGFPPERVSRAGGLASLLRNWRALIVMDNFEHLVESSGWLAELAASCPGVKLLVTSRVRLGLTGERTVALKGLSVESTAGTVSDAARLFIDRADRAGLEGPLTATEVAEIEALCIELDGYPLGLELAAGLLRVLPLAKLRPEVRRSLDVLAQGPVDAPERHRAVRAAFDPSWRRLSKREREAALRLTVFRGGCDLDSALAVGADRDSVAGLVDQAFLTHDSRVGRFFFHPLVRGFVAAKLSDALFLEARTAHRDHFAALLDRAALDYRTTPVAALDALAKDSANILSAVEWTFGAGDTAGAVAMLMRFLVDCDYLEARGGGAEMVDLIERVAESAVVAGDLAAANRLLARAGDAYRLFTSRDDEGLRLYHRALELAELGNETDRRVTLLGLLGALAVFDDPSLAQKNIELATELAVAAGDDLMLCNALNSSGYVSHALGDKEEMRVANSRIVSIASRLLTDARYRSQLPRIESNLYFALHNLGVAEDDLGMLEESLEHRNEALRFAEQRGHRLWQGYAHEELSFLHLQLGAVETARSHAEAARDSFRSIGAELSLLRLEERLSADDPEGLIAV